MSEKLDKLRASLEKEKERRIKINNRIESLERRIQEAEAAEVNEMVRTAKVTPEQLAALLRQSTTSTPNPAALSAVGAGFVPEKPFCGAKSLDGTMGFGVSASLEFVVLALSAAVFVAGGIAVTMNAHGQISAAMKLPMECYYACIPIGGALMILYSLNNLYHLFRDKNKEVA